MLAFAVYENELGAQQPLGNEDKMLFLTEINGEKYEKITHKEYDSTLVNGKWKIDSTISTSLNKAKRAGMASGGFGDGFSQKRIAPLGSVEEVSQFCCSYSLETVENNELMEWQACLTDVGYWKVFNFAFLEGQPFPAEAIANKAQQIILTKDAAEQYFGKRKSYLGMKVHWGLHGLFEVVGVVKNPQSTNPYIQSHCFLPSTWNFKGFSHDIFGESTIAVLVSGQVPFKAEVEKLAEVLSTQEEYDWYKFHIKTPADLYADKVLGESEKGNRGHLLGLFFYTVAALFVVVPLLNLINLNVTRVNERAGEIGVRKSFGANSSQIFQQFLFENILLTAIGGLLALGFTYFIIKLLNGISFFGVARIELDLGLLAIYVGISLILACLSGAIPAWRISKLKIVGALKNGQK